MPACTAKTSLVKLVLNPGYFACFSATMCCLLYVAHHPLKRVAFVYEFYKFFLAESSDTRFEDPTVSGLQETLCFEKSGVILQFSDPESFVNDGQGIRSKICWDKALTVSLPSHEIQLSPVVQFYPHGSKLSKPVHATIPHSALMDSNHGWSIGLKSFSLKSGPKIGWKEEMVDKIHDNEVSFYMDFLLSYVVVGTPVYKSSRATKKRFQCAVFGDKEGKVGQDYTVYLYLIDDCEASLKV